MESRTVLDRRRAGVLLHPTSLPGAFGSGDIGEAAFHFSGFLRDCGFSVWQTLPLGPPCSQLSPYKCKSAHAGNPALISLEALLADGLLESKQLKRGKTAQGIFRQHRLNAAWQNFRAHAGTEEIAALERFEAENSHWLHDFCSYTALQHAHKGKAWWQWPTALRDRKPSALAASCKDLADEIASQRFQQFIFFRQWDRLKQHVNKMGIQLFGDMPLFVAEDSAEVWAGREQFRIDDRGHLEVVAGVPPDYFSADGQRWGNPHYHWSHMEADGFDWWVKRMQTQLQLFDLVRIDHFRGLEAQWEIPAKAKTAREGCWVKGRGEALLGALQSHFHKLPLVAEDLGHITPEVHALREHFGLPGMQVLQFAFDGNSENPYLPHNHVPESVVYTGTHDNNTSAGWFSEQDKQGRARICEYLDSKPEKMPAALVRAALTSVSRLAIIPMQDLLGLDSTHRMNVPGTSRGNWTWRFSWDQVPPELAGHMRELIKLYGRGLNG